MAKLFLGGPLVPRQSTMLRPFAVLLVLGLTAAASLAQGGGGGGDKALPTTPYSQMPARKDAEAPDAKTLDEAVARGVAVIVNMQEGDSKGEWPYEGVYRERGRIPIGYRVGGTGISGMCLLRAPGYDADEARKGAVRRAAEFVIAGADDPAMVPDHDSTYDVRGWGYTYGCWYI